MPLQLPRVYPPHQLAGVILLGQQEHLRLVVSDPRTFVEMKQSEIAWPDRRNKRPVKEQLMSVKPVVAHGSEVKGAVVMLWAGAGLVEESLEQVAPSPPPQQVPVVEVVVVGSEEEVEVVSEVVVAVDEVSNRTPNLASHRQQGIARLELTRINSISIRPRRISIAKTRR